MLEGWLERMDGGWEVININSTNSKSEKNEPCESSMKHNECGDKVKEKNESEMEDGNVSVASWDQQVQCSSVSHFDGRVLLSPTRTRRGSNQSCTAEPGVESAGEDAHSTVVDTSPYTTNSRLSGRRLGNADHFHQQSTKPIAPICPMCDNTMIYKSNRKGGFFLRMSQMAYLPWLQRPARKKPRTNSFDHQTTCYLWT